MAREEPSKGVTVMVNRDMANRLRVVAAHRRLTMAEALDKWFGPTLDREYRKVLAEVGAEKPTAKAGA